MLQLRVRTYATLSFHVNMYYCTIIVRGRVLGSNGIVHSMWVIIIRTCFITEFVIYISYIAQSFLEDYNQTTST